MTLPARKKIAFFHFVVGKKAGAETGDHSGRAAPDEDGGYGFSKR